MIKVNLKVTLNYKQNFKRLFTFNFIFYKFNQYMYRDFFNAKAYVMSVSFRIIGK